MNKKIFFLTYFIKNSFSFQHKIPIDYISYSRVKKIIKEVYNINDKKNNLEHIVPQSLFKENKKLKSDMHNIILYPEKMNLHRSNFEYISDFKIYPNSKLIDTNGEIINYVNPINDKNICIKTSSKKYFLPEAKYKGLISRSCMYILSSYPSYKEIILKNVINPFTLLTWHHQHPVTEFERYKNDKIYEFQGNKNEFICNPKLLVDVMEDILNTEIKVFKNYKY